MKHALAFLLMMGALCAYSQQKFTVSGTVKDQANGETMIGANVLLRDDSGAVVTGGMTNEYGFYSITVVEGSYQLSVSFLGYAATTKSISLTESQKINFEIAEEDSQLETVEITAESDELEKIQNTEMSVAKIQQKTIKQITPVLGEVDVIKSIQLLPGITNAGEGASGFNVRGGAEDQNLVLLDEAIIYNTSHLFGFFSVFNADAVKDIKLYKGGIPAQYGGRASSVLDIRQKDGNSKKLALTGGISSISSRLAVEGPLLNKKGAFLLAGRSSYAHLLMQTVDQDNTASFYDLNLKANYQLGEKDRIYLSGYMGNDQITFANVLGNSYGNVSGTLRWNHIFGDRLFSNLSAIYSRYDYQLDIHNFGLDWQSEIENFNLRYDLKYYLSDRLKLDFGLSGIYYDFDPGTINPIDAESGINPRSLDSKFAMEAAAYASLEHKITDRLTAQYGLRYSYFNRFGPQPMNIYPNGQPISFNPQLGIYQRNEAIGTQDFGDQETIAEYGNFEPRFSLGLQLDDQSSVKASYNRMAQYLHLISNTASATPLDVWAPSGQFLKPQIADQVALGYFRNFRDARYSMEVEGYYKMIDNRVDYIDGAELIAQNTLETEVLIGESRAYGLELLVRKNKGNLTGWAAYTLSRAEQRTEGGEAGGPGINGGDWYRAVYDRTHDLSLTGNYKLNGKWSIGANFAFQTGRPVTNPNGQYFYNGFSIPTYSNRNADRLPAYHRLDVSATARPYKNADRRWQSEWVFSIYNLYNRNNAASIAFNQDLETGVNQATLTYIFGIIPSVTYNFKF